MITEELIGFIKRQKNIGVSDETLYSILEPEGWTRKDYQEALQAIEAERKELAAPSVGVQTPVDPAFPDLSTSSGVASTSGPAASFSSPAPTGQAVSTFDDEDATVDLSSSAISREPMQVRELGAQSQPDQSLATLDVDEDLVDLSSAPTPVGPPPSADLNHAMQQRALHSQDKVAPSPTAENPQSVATPPMGAQQTNLVQSTPQNTNDTALVNQANPAPTAPLSTLGSGFGQQPITTQPAQTQMTQTAQPGQGSSWGTTPAAAPSPSPSMPSSQTAPAPAGPGSADVPPDLTQRGKKKSIGKILLIVLGVLLLVVTGLQLGGVLGIPGLPVLVQNNSQLIREAHAYLFDNSELGAVDFRATVQLNHQTDTSQSMSATLSGNHEFFSVEQQQGIYSFRFNRGPSSAAGEVRFIGEQLWVRFLEASPDIEMLDLPVEDFIAAWFAFDRGSIVANGSLLLDPDQILPSQPMPSGQAPSEVAAELTRALLGQPVQSVSVGDGSTNQTGVEVLIDPRWSQTVASTILANLDFLLGGYADNQEVSQIITTLENQPAVVAVSGDNAPVTFSIPMSATASDMGALSGGLEIQFTAFNQPVDVQSPGQAISYFDYIEQTDQRPAGLVLDGTELLRRTLQDARLNTVIDGLAIAARDARESFQSEQSYGGICQGETTQEVFEALIDIFPEIAPECMAGEESFMLFTAFDGGYVCADSERFVGLLDQVPTGMSCVVQVEQEATSDSEVVPELEPAQNSATATPVL